MYAATSNLYFIFHYKFTVKSLALLFGFVSEIL